MSERGENYANPEERQKFQELTLDSSEERELKQVFSIFYKLSDPDQDMKDEEMDFYVDDIERSKGLLQKAYCDPVHAFGVLHILQRMVEHGYKGAPKAMVRLKNLALEIMTESALQTERYLTDRIFNRYDWFKSLYVLGEKGNETQKQHAHDILARNLDKVIEEFGKRKAIYPYGQILETLLFNGKDHEQQLALHSIIEFLQKNPSSEFFPYFVSALFKHGQEESERTGIEYLERFLTKYGLPFAEFYEAWKKSHPSFREAVMQNMCGIRDLEKEQVGVCKFLFKEFGIADFGRYPVKMLIRQYQEFENLQNPYGVIIFPRDDWNGAFYNDRPAFQSLYEKLKVSLA